MQVIAKQLFAYKGGILRPGDMADVTPELARAWVMMQRADIRAEDGTEQPRQKRRYRRRDMRVED